MSLSPDVVTVAVTRVDGGVTVLRVITTEYGPAGPNWTIDPTPAYIDAIIAKHNWTGPLAPTGWHLVPNDYVDDQTDRTFRNAWRHTAGNGKPEVDMPKARDLHRNRLRDMRAPLLEALDVEYSRADERGDAAAKKAVADKKQALRDIPADPRIEAAQTQEELKAVLPEPLGG